MEHHDCKPPGGRQPGDVSPWTCPDCGDVWEAEPPIGTGPAIGFDFATGDHVQNSRWVRIGQPDD